MSHEGRRVFVIGPGFIGWHILDALVAEGYHVKTLVRRLEGNSQITSSGAELVIGSLEDKEVITKHTFESDIVISTVSTDHLPSVQAVRDGIVLRAERELPTIYLHNSGSVELDDGAAGEYKTDKIYTDEKPEDMNALSDKAPHRHVDLEVLKIRNGIGKKAKVAIVVPPLIYGYWPQNPRLSIQIPALARYALKHGHSGYVGKGLSVISTVHVRDVMTAYLTILHHIEKTPGSSEDLDRPYYFIEANGDHEPSWLEIAEAIGQGLHKAERLDGPKPQTISKNEYKDLLGDFTPAGLGCNARSRADRLAKLGWKPTHKDWRASLLEDELPIILQE